MSTAILTMNTNVPMGFQSNIVEITDATFAERLGGSPTPVLLAFCIAGCSACHRLLTLLAAAAPRCGGFVTIAKADRNESPALAARFGICSVPAVLLCRGGTVSYQFIGDLSRPELDEMLAQAVTNRSPAAQYH